VDCSSFSLPDEPLLILPECKKQNSIRLGSEQAFDEIFRELYPALCYYGYKISGNQGVSEDMAGDAFIKVWERREMFHNFNVLRSFLYAIVRNASLNWLEQQKSQARAQAKILPLLEQHEKSNLEHLVMAETYRELHDAIKELPRQCRKVITLSFIEGMSGKEIADKLHMEHGTVRSHKNRGIMLLQKRLRYFLQSFL
jgi:RNA polymerase sigma-70 factor (family 1)